MCGAAPGAAREFYSAAGGQGFSIATNRQHLWRRTLQYDGSVTHHPYAGPARGPARDEPVVGAVVDGVFVTSDRRSPARDRRPASRVDDKYSKKIVGAKTMLVSVICPSSDDCATAYDYELIASDHGGDVISYLEEVVALAQDFWTANSWGNFTVDVAITPILEVDYDQSTCDDHDELDWYGGGYDGDPEAFDVLAAHASLAEGYDRESYDFNVVVVPYCQANGAAGTGSTTTAWSRSTAGRCRRR